MLPIINQFFTEPGDYLETTGPGIFFLARAQARRSCFQLFIIEDDILEDDEFLFLDLSFDTRFSQEGIAITLNSTGVTILWYVNGEKGYVTIVVALWSITSKCSYSIV